MNQVSSIPTLIIASVLSCHSVAPTIKNRRCGLDRGDESAGDQRALDDMLRGTAFALALSYNMAKTLSLSHHPGSDFNFITSESSEIFPDFDHACLQRSNSCNSSTDRTELAVELESTPDTTCVFDMASKGDEPDILHCVQDYYIVDDNNVVMDLWMRRARLWAFTPRSPLHLNMLQIKQNGGVPAMTHCDSLTSLSSRNSIGSRSSSDFLSMRPTMKNDDDKSEQGNAEWAIIE